MASANGGLPSFQWDEKEVSLSGVPLLKVFYPNGENDVADLKKVSSEACIFNGHLRKESTSFVALSGGCPFSNTFEIQFHSAHLPKSFAYTVESGVVSLVKSPFERADVRDQHLLQDDFAKKFNKKLSNRIAFPPNGYDLKVKFYYDQLFKNKFGANSTAKLDAVENFAQGFYLLPSLTTQIHFIRTPHEELQISFTDGANTTTLQVYIFQLSNF